MAHHTSAFSRPHTIVLALGALLVALALGALAGAPTALAAKNCGQIDLPGDGYVTSIFATNVGCKTARRVARSYADCRLAKGKTARCTRKVRGYSCKELSRTKIPTELNARVRCSLRGRVIVHTYEQRLR